MTVFLILLVSSKNINIENRSFLIMCQLLYSYCCAIIIGQRGSPPPIGLGMDPPLLSIEM